MLQNTSLREWLHQVCSTDIHPVLLHLAAMLFSVYLSDAQREAIHPPVNERGI